MFDSDLLIMSLILLLDPPVAEVPIGVLQNDENQNLEIDIDLTKIDRNRKLDLFKN